MKKAMRKTMLVLLAVSMTSVLCLGGCGKKPDGAKAPEPVQETEAVKERETQEGVQDKMEEPVILVVSFGTSYNENRSVTIEAVEADIQKGIPGCSLRTAYTSQIIIDKLRERDGLEIDNVQEALERAAADGVETLVVQPTHLMDGFEYTDLANELAEYESYFKSVALGEPLLTGDGDFDAVVAAITDSTKEYDDGETAIVFMGHGTEAESNEVYETLQEKLAAAGFGNYYIGTVEAEPALEDVVACLKENGSYKKVVLQPLMLVAGDHANNDMAGEEDSWKTVFENEGYEVTCILKGLGELPAVRDIYVAHAKAALESLAK